MKELEWHTIPDEETADWDVLYKNVAAFLLRHAVSRAISIVEYDGCRYICHVNLEPIPDQIN
jgi:hypothetical protein